jgi:hypothetical protein
VGTVQVARLDAGASQGQQQNLGAQREPLLYGRRELDAEEPGAVVVARSSNEGVSSILHDELSEQRLTPRNASFERSLMLLELRGLKAAVSGRRIPGFLA